MILSELIRRGRGERILVVTPRTSWSRSSASCGPASRSFVRLDSAGIQRSGRSCPASRNPFAYFKRAIVSIDTLKSDRYLAHLREAAWDAVVIDESHNLINAATQNNRLARILAPRTDALILASRHAAQRRSRVLRRTDPDARPERRRGPTASSTRRRSSTCSSVGTDTAPRSRRKSAPTGRSGASPTTCWSRPRDREEIADELAENWLTGEAVAVRGAELALVPLDLARRSSPRPRLCSTTIRSDAHDASATSNRRQRDRRSAGARDLAERNTDDGVGEVRALVEHLAGIGVRPGARHAGRGVLRTRSDTEVGSSAKLRKDLRLQGRQVVVLHGGLSDVEQMRSSSRSGWQTSPIRVLVTGDVASEGVNLHLSVTIWSTSTCPGR